jgi:hypothetical protein
VDLAFRCHSTIRCSGGIFDSSKNRFFEGTLVVLDSDVQTKSNLQTHPSTIQAEQERKVAIEREMQQARLKKEKEERAELRGKYADDKCARTEDGWKAQV